MTVRWLGLGILLMMSGLAACSTGQPSGSDGNGPDGSADIPPVAGGAAGTILAEGAVEPNRWVELSFAIPGTVVAVNVEEGQLVQPGEILVRLAATDAELAVQQARAVLALAQAQLALVQAGSRPEQVAVLEAQLAAAVAAVDQATAQVQELTAGTVSADIKDAQVGVILADVSREQAVDAHNSTLRCVTVGLPDGSDRHICPALGPYEEMARYQMNAASAGLQAVQAELDATAGSTASRISAAMAAREAAIGQRDVVQAQLDLAIAGSRDEDIAAAEASVQQAEAALAQARAAIEDTMLAAPFSGTVVQLGPHPGDVVVPGRAYVVVATLDEMRVRTKDLTELDVVKVAVGQPATLKMDALPDQPQAGHVVRIEKQSTDRFGDVTYSVLLSLDGQVPETWRWGMTVWVEIQFE